MFCHYIDSNEQNANTTVTPGLISGQSNGDATRREILSRLHGTSAINVGTVFRFSRIFSLVCHAIPDLNEKPHQTLGLKGRRKKLSADVTVKYT